MSPTSSHHRPGSNHPPGSHLRPGRSLAAKSDTPSSSDDIADDPDRVTSLETRDRLIAAAGEVFAELGFRRATIRAICARANVNIAAVNYYFGGKRGLYAAVLTDAHQRSLDRYPALLDTTPDDPPQVRFEAFIRSFLLRMLDAGRPAWHGALMIREMADPTPALDQVVHHSIRVQFAALLDLLRDVVVSMKVGNGDSAHRVDDEALRRCAMSIVAQCLYYRMARPVIERLSPGRYGAEEIDELVRHVTIFSLAGLRAATTVDRRSGST